MTAPTVQRAVEWLPPDPGEWSLESAHGSELMAVTMQNAMCEAFSEGTRAGLKPYGLPLSHAEMHFVNGWPYFSFFLHDVPRSSGGRTPPDFVIKLITRIHPGFRRRTRIARAALAERRAQRAAAEWFDDRQDWIDRLVDLQDFDPDAASDAELADHLELSFRTADQGARRHFELIFACSPLGWWFVRAAEWGLDAGDARAAVMYGTPVHEEARARLDRVVDALGAARPGSIAELRTAGPQVSEAFDEYLRYHGRWSISDSARGRCLADHPQALLAAIDARRSARGAVDPDSTGPGLVERLRSRVPAVDHDEFDTLVADAHETYKMLDDNSGILASWTSGILGTDLHAAAARLAANGRIEAPDHMWAVPFDAVLELLRGTSTRTAGDIAAAHDRWQAQGRLDPPRFLGDHEPSDPPDPSVFPQPVARLMAGVLAFVGDKFNERQQPVGVGSHTVVGRAVVAEHAGDALDRLEPGDILVSIATTPAFNTVLGIAGGVIVAEGGPSCHTAIVARELGLPALVGHADALAIPDGAVIELDPCSASVTILSR